MSDSEKPSESGRRGYWLQLASQLGATVPDEPEVTSVSEGAEETADAGSEANVLPRERARAPRVLPARPPSDWGTLCEQLGLPAPPARPSKSQAGPEPVPEESIEPYGSAERDAESDRIEEAEPEPSECVCRDDHELAELELDELDLAEFDEELTPSGPMSAEPDATGGEVERFDDDPGRREPASRRRRRRGRRRPVSEKATPGESAEESLEAGPDDWDADDFTTPAGDPVVSTPQMPEEEGEDTAAVPARRPRRRRRSARSAQPAAHREGSEFESTDDDHEMADAGQGELELDSDDEEDELSAGSAHRSKHRKIPTWEEAVGVIVTANLQARAQGDQSKNRHRGSRRRGRDGNDRNA